MSRGHAEPAAPATPVVSGGEGAGLASPSPPPVRIARSRAAERATAAAAASVRPPAAWTSASARSVTAWP
ncbi:MAG TPA: hypothetical protein VLW53_06935, partial [Candidatus Eisenbacteria bacterium]|nr:hypothetical protein [Candidatus Eisenbacteria bacterium]